MTSFKLSAVLRGHDADVRAVLFPSPDTLISASRDNTVRVWRKKSETPPVFEGSPVTQGQEFINSLAYIDRSAEYPDGLVVSGGKDSIIDVRKPTAQPTDNAERLLIGHAHNVCTLDVAPTGRWLVSGGWDGQARVWKIGGTWETQLLLKHDVGGSVWAVLAYNEGTVITGCADEMIRVFILPGTGGGEVDARVTIRTPAVVRAVCKLPSGLTGHPSGADFASAGNDSVIRLWKLNGTQVAELHGHDSFIYSLACLPSAEIVSSGEDRTVRIWRNKECVQTITHPAISVWTVAVCPNGDIASGASDYVMRIFTRSQERMADDETMAQFEQSVKASAIPQQQLGNINKEKLDLPEWLQTHAGTKEGQVKMIRELNGSVGAYQWSMGQQEWIIVGTVVDSAGSSGRKVEYDAKEYDYVFDVDIEDGKPPLKLPYNLSENVYERATRFLNDNNLPATYLDSVANFITENTKGASIGQSSQSPGADPFGSEKRYRPGEQSEAKVKAKPSPDQDYLFMTNGKIDAAHQKLLTTNKKLMDSGHKDVAMNPSETSILDDVVAVMGSTGLDANKLAVLNLPAGGVPLLFKLAGKWPYGERLAALDLLRLVAATPAVMAVEKPGTLVDVMLDGSLTTDGAVNPNNVMMALRAVGNLFATEPGRTYAVKHAKAVADGAARIVGLVDGAPPVGAGNRNLHVALATVLFDYMLLAYKDHAGGRGTTLHGTMVKAFARVLGAVLTKQQDAETAYRALRALELVAAMGGDGLTAAREMGAEAWVRAARENAAEARVIDLADACLSALRGRPEGV